MSFLIFLIPEKCVKLLLHKCVYHGTVFIFYYDNLPREYIVISEGWHRNDNNWLFNNYTFQESAGVQSWRCTSTK